MYSVCNNTKWSELREAMLGIPEEQRPKRRSVVLDGFESDYDGEWYYHFRDGGYDELRHIDVKSPNDVIDAAVLLAIRKLHLAASRVGPNIWRIFGYVADTNLAKTP